MTNPLQLDAGLARAARAAGIALSYSDALGRHRDVSRDTLRACLAAMGFDAGRRDVAREVVRRRHEAHLAVLTQGKGWRLAGAWSGDGGSCVIITEDGQNVAASLSDGGVLVAESALPLGYHSLIYGKRERERKLAVCPPRGFWPEWMERGERRWGIAAQLYSLRGESRDDIGDFADLAELMERVRSAGGDAVLINPVTAGFLAQPHRKSPYQTSDRRFLNALMIDTGTDSGGPADAIDYPVIVPRRLAELRRMFSSSKDRDETALVAWRKQTPSALEGFAAWEAGTLPDPSADAVRFHQWLQFRADTALAACAPRGNATGIIRDLPVGPAQDGYETISQPKIFARGVDVGAPPDLLAPKGQNWGVAAYNPIALAEAGYEPFLELMRANMRHAGALRIDHVMSLSRLFWIPSGTEEGTYVRYPLEELSALASLESVRQRCVLIGEDLGTVAPSLRVRLKQRGFLSTRVVLFERRSDGGLIPPSRYPYASVASMSTHDMPTFRAWWRRANAWERRDFAQKLQETRKRWPKTRSDPLGFASTFLRLALFLGCTRSALRLFRLEDVALERRSINVPGTGDEHQNWSLRLRWSLKQLLDDAQNSRIWSRVINAMQSSR
jgi:4-alpha-glucanotransferase